jgi:hypothetical protein
MPPRSRVLDPRWPLSAALLLVLSILIGAWQPAHAGSYLPLVVGNDWEYASPDGRHETQRITGTTVLRGRTVFVKRYEQSVENEGLENYWIEEPGGRLLLCGFFRADSGTGWGIAYEPPICMADAPLSLGRTWTTSSQSFMLPGMEPVSPLEVRFEVLEAGDLATPAGTFFAYGVGAPQYVATPLARCSVTGEAISASVRGASGMPAEAAPTDWYCEGVGVVQYSSDALYQLTGYGSPTAVAASTWGRLKNLYR